MRRYVVETDAILHNLDVLLQMADGTPIWAVLKGNGYGLGVQPMAELCWSKGIRSFAVTEVSEARTIRTLYRNARILMLRPTVDPEELRQLLELDAIATIGSTEEAETLNRLAIQEDQLAQVHLKIDTGMGRYGFMPQDLAHILQVFRTCEHLTVCGIYTHFHTAFGKQEITFAQAETFRSTVQAIRDAGYDPGEAHCCNSTAFVRWPELKEDGVRLGSAILGRLLVRSDLIWVGHCEATVEQVRWLPAGHSTGYGAAWTAKRPTKTAVIPVGWYHGFTNEYGHDIFRVRDCLREMLKAFRRIFHKKVLTVTINGTPCPVLGHVGMLHTVCDVSQIPCKVGDPVQVPINPLQVRGMEIQFR